MTAIQICDSIPGSGKTEAAINYMNSHPEKKYLFITPFRTEISRIQQSCPALRFTTPHVAHTKNQDKHTLSVALRLLLEKGKNIVTTHALLDLNAREIEGFIKANGYTLILDESFNTIEKFKMSASDMAVLKASGLIEIKDGYVNWKGDGEYTGRMYKDLFAKSKTHTLIHDGPNLMYWMFPPDIFTVFKEAFILTYLFEGQFQRCYFDMYNIPYQYIGVKKDDNGYSFSDTPTDLAPFRNLKEKITIWEDKDGSKYNAIGESRTALSSRWYSRESETRCERMRNNIYNIFHYRWESKAKLSMWTCFKKNQKQLEGKRYKAGFVDCASRATNRYRHKTHLAYCVNSFIDPFIKNYFQRHDIYINEDIYALSNMLQWIFRSAIRDGGNIFIYIPSSRMRNLLQNWLDELAETPDTSLSLPAPDKE